MLRDESCCNPNPKALHIHAEYDILSKKQQAPTTATTTTTTISRKQGDTIQGTMFTVAGVVTMETKYCVVPWVAEYWCTITSPFFALPVLIYTMHPFAELSIFTNVCVACSILTAAMSTIYHATLYRIWSLLDCVCATVMFYLIVLNQISTLGSKSTISIPLPFSLFALASGTTTTSTNEETIASNETTSITLNVDALATPLPAICICLSIVIYFLRHWRATHIASIKSFVALMPLSYYAYFQCNLQQEFFVGLLGIACFLLDRFRFAKTHSLWHFFGGLCLLMTLDGVTRISRNSTNIIISSEQ